MKQGFAVRWLIAITSVLAVLIVVPDISSLVLSASTFYLSAVVYGVALVLMSRPMRARLDTSVNAADVAIFAGVILLPPGAVALAAALARVTTDVVRRQRPDQIARNSASIAVAAGVAGIVFSLATSAGAPFLGSGIAISIAGVLAVLTYVVLDVAQILLLYRALGRPLDRATRVWAIATGRAEMVWGLVTLLTLGLAAYTPTILIVLVPLLILGYFEMRTRFSFERRASLLATLVEVGHDVGTSLEPNEIFRSVYKRVRAVMDADSFYVAIADHQHGTLTYRFRVDDEVELEPRDRPMEGSLAGIAIKTAKPVLIHDQDEARRQGLLPPRSGWGTVHEKSIIVAPMRLRGGIVGAISAQSVRIRAYDEGDLELLGAIGQEAAIAIERADLYSRTVSLSRRLVDLHRIGIELSAQHELPALTKRLAASVVDVIGALRAAVYLDNGGSALEFAAIAGDKRTTETPTISKDSPTIAALSAGRTLEISDSSAMPDEQRELLEARGQRALVMQPLRAGDESIGVLFVTWGEPHALKEEERELIGVLAGLGASAIRSIKLYGELDEAYLATVSTLMATIEARDGYREDHQRRVAAEALALGERTGLGEEDLRDLRYASLFHAIGKIGVPTAILSKQGPLTTEERRVLQEHPLLGARILESIRHLRGVVPIVLHANERWDGSGYPDGLAGDRIPLTARILQVAVAYCALISDRPYRAALPQEEAIHELRMKAGTHFDPTCVETFVSMLEGRGAVEAVSGHVGAASRELAILSEITPEFHTLLEPQQLLDRILKILESHMPGASLAIRLRDPSTNDLVVRASAGSRRDFGPQVRLSPGQGISGWVMQNLTPQLVDDVRADPRFVGDERVRSEMVAPLITEGRAIGTLVVSHPQVAAFRQSDLTLMQAVCSQIAAGIEVAELHDALRRAANTDALTELHNYRYFYDRLDEEISRAERRTSPLAVAYFDIDGLKRVNDTYGHVAGDEVLRTLGSVLSAGLRTEDVPARYGGDEFAIVMPDTPREEAEKVMVRLMETLDSTEVMLSDGTRIAMPRRGWGVASYPIDGTDARTLVENADTRAYAKKRAPRPSLDPARRS